VSNLVHVASLFGVSENRARVALSRMVAAGEAATYGDGRYQLAGHLLERQHRQIESREGRSRPWRGEWHVVVVRSGAATAAQRMARSRAFRAARLASLREGTWARPDNIELVLRPEVTGGVIVLQGRLLRTNSPEAALVRSLFELDRWSARAEALSTEMTDLSIGGPEDLAAGFLLSAAVLRHLQADPLLPEELLPGDWPGRRLRTTYDKWDTTYRWVLATWSRSPDGLNRRRDALAQPMV
ncbi:MAG: PaaX family transcriptional regulator C-terminal domain-containing protein, partial [Acidimicrobiales bacterium]